ncbi:MAG: hypothetical protein H8E34_13920 [Bacteroidetes bacterium]|nr:hypothetical protein [Bacteroidota bacterium]
MTELIFSYSWWTILLVIFTGLVYAAILYVKNPLNKLSYFLTVVLFILRFFLVALLSFLLLSPTIKTKKKQIEKPIIIFGQDNSRSILMCKDSLYHTDTLIHRLAGLMTKLRQKNDVESYIFGNKVKAGNHPDYSDNTSNYSDFFKNIKLNYIGLNVGAVILVGDGIINNGIDPVYSASDITYPIFTIALGDTIQTKDIKIEDVRHNSIVYSGDIFPLEVSLSANILKGKKAFIKLLENNKVIAQKEELISTDNYRKSVTFSVETENAGKRRYVLAVEPVTGETNFENNVRNIFIDVLNSRQKILILAYAPHPDVGAIKQSLSKNKNYQVETEYINSFNKDVNEFDLVILHQLPSKKNAGIRLLKNLSDTELPVLFILGNQSQISVFNNHFVGLNISSAVGSTVSAQFEFNNTFAFFSFNDDFTTQLSSLPPLSVPLGNYSLAPGAEVFGWQRINNIRTNFPLIAFYQNIGVKSGVICGEGLWLWRMQDNLKYDNTLAIDAFLNKAVMFLIANTDKRQFKINTKGEYDCRLDVILNAELYNQSLEPDNSSEVRLTLTNENNEKFNFVFSPYNDYYKLNLNKLPVGVYHYQSSVKLGKNNFDDSGEFIVQQLDNESRNLNADHNMLNRLASEHDGEMYYPDNINDLFTNLQGRNEMTSKIHYEDKFIALNSVLYILILLIFLLSVEWFLRKFFGSY